MGKDRLEELIDLRDSLEDAYIRVTAEIKSEQLANALVTLANNEGVMLYLDRQNLGDNIETANDHIGGGQ
jgi:hypothetical protein